MARATATIAAAAGLLALVGGDAPALENLNGGYLISPTPKAADQTGQPAWAQRFSSYPKPVKYFDAYSAPFETLYSQVWWAGLPPRPIPEHVVQEFAGGKVMAVVGFECDQVIRTREGDVSVPITVAYNHHFDGKLNNGKKSRLEKLSADDPRIAEMARGHGVPHQPYVAVEHTPGVNGAPTSLQLGGGNGGEYRKTFHGFPPGFAQLIESPTEMQITPMQIDTWHREQMTFNATHISPFVSGPVPRNAVSPTSGPDAQYSGLLECPLTTRITKDIDAGYDVKGAGTCTDEIQTAAECFSAVGKALGAVAKLAATHIVDDPTLPKGCSVAATNSTHVDISFNTASAAAACGANAKTHVGATDSLVKIAVEMDLAADLATITLTGPSNVW